jgi:Na+/melibiose symporter-like transporter
MSLYFFIQKLAAAIGVGVALPVAALLGFNPQSTGIGASTGGIMFVAAVLPSIIALPAVFLLFNYPISEKRHAEIRQELRERGLET